MNAKQIADRVKSTGIVWLGGEMELPANEGAGVAYTKAVEIAEACGYVVSWKRHSHCAFSVVGGDIPGEVVLDWFAPGAMALVKIEVWTAQAAYLK